MLGSWKSDFHRVFEVDWRLLVGHSINGYDANSDSSLVSRACRGKPFDREWWTHSLLNEIDDSWLSSTNSETKAQYLTQLFAAKYWNILECSTRKDLDEPFFFELCCLPPAEIAWSVSHHEPSRAQDYLTPMFSEKLTVGSILSSMAVAIWLAYIAKVVGAWESLQCV